MTWASLLSTFNVQMSLIALGVGCLLMFSYLYVLNFSRMVDVLRRRDPEKWKSIGCPQPFGKVVVSESGKEASAAWTRFSMAIDLHEDPEIARMQKKNRVFVCVAIAGVALIVAGAVGIPLYRMFAPGR